MAVSKEPFPAPLHIQRLVKELEKGQDNPGESPFVVLVQGAHTANRHDTDRELPFRQESNFLYLTGCQVPSSFLLIAKPAASDGKASAANAGIHVRLFIPKPDLAVSMWSGPQPTTAQVATQSGFSSDQMQVVEYATDSEISSYVTSLSQNLSPSGPSVKSPNAVPVYTLPYPSAATSLQEELLYPFSPVINGLIADSKLDPTSKRLLWALQNVRLIKTPQEIEHIREANRITSEAHEVVMRELGRFAKRRLAGANDSKTGGRSGAAALSEWEIESEADAEAVFVAACKRQGAAQAYLPIVASGSRASTLHYVCNDKLFPPAQGRAQNPSADQTFHDHSTTANGTPKANGRGCCSNVPVESFNDLSHHTSSFLPQVLLIDAGCEVAGGYASDVTRTIPIGNGGKFTKEGREIYELVLKMQKASEAECRAGVHWDDLHLLCHRILAEEFLRLGIFKNATVEELLDKSLTWAFLPHGLGHSMGLDVHDSLQLLRSEHHDIPESSKRWPRLFQYLRIRRKLEAGMVLTIEPGCYFSDDLMGNIGIKQSPLVDLEILERYKPVGGVRLEDDVVVTETGCENLTTIGREVDWVEAVCGGRA